MPELKTSAPPPTARKRASVPLHRIVSRRWNYDLKAAPAKTLLELKKGREIYRGYKYTSTTYFTCGLGYLWADAWRVFDG